jgi:hypothetical protein
MSPERRELRRVLNCIQHAGSQIYIIYIDTHWEYIIEAPRLNSFCASVSKLCPHFQPISKAHKESASTAKKKSKMYSPTTISKQRRRCVFGKS